MGVLKDEIFDKNTYYQLSGQNSGKQVIIVNAPIGLYMKKLAEKETIFETTGVKAETPYARFMNAYGIIEVKTWDDFLDEVCMICVSFMKEGTIKDDGDKEETGKPFFESARSYINSVGAEHDDYYAACMDLRVKSAPGINELNTKQEVSLVNEILKKKDIMPRLSGFNYTTLKSFTATLAKQHETLHQENLQNLSSLRGAEMRISELEKTETKKKTKKE